MLTLSGSGRYWPVSPLSTDPGGTRALADTLGGGSPVYPRPMRLTIFYALALAAAALTGLAAVWLVEAA